MSSTNVVCINRRKNLLVTEAFGWYEPTGNSRWSLSMCTTENGEPGWRTFVAVRGTLWSTQDNGTPQDGFRDVSGCACEWVLLPYGAWEAKCQKRPTSIPCSRWEYKFAALCRHRSLQRLRTIAHEKWEPTVLMGKKSQFRNFQWKSIDSMGLRFHRYNWSSFFMSGCWPHESSKEGWPSRVFL